MHLACRFLYKLHIKSMSRKGGEYHEDISLPLSKVLACFKTHENVLLCIRQYLLQIPLFTCVCNILMFNKFEIDIYLYLREKISSKKEFLP